MNFIISWVSRNVASILFIGGMVLLVAILLYKGMDTIKGKLGFDTVESVKKELNVAKTNTDTAINTNKELNSEIKRTKESGEVSVATIESLIQENKRTIEELKKIIDERDEKIKLLLDETESTPDSNVTEVRTEEVTTTISETDKAFTGTTQVKKKLVKKKSSQISKKISQIQISAIWTKYKQVEQTNNWS